MNTLYFFVNLYVQNDWLNNIKILCFVYLCMKTVYLYKEYCCEGVFLILGYWLEITF